MQTAAEKITYERPLTVVPDENTRALSEAVRDSLGMMGRIVPWETRKEDNGNLYITIWHPAKKSRIHILFNENKVEVEEQRRGVQAAFYSLHALSNVPGSSYLGYWSIYTEICTYVVFFSAISGVYLWTARRSERIIGYSLLSVAGATALFMLYFWLWG